MNATETKKVIPFDQLLYQAEECFPGPPPFSESQWIDSIQAERVRRIAAALPEEYVAVPSIKPSGYPFQNVMVWQIMGPKIEKPRLDANGNRPDRLPISIGVAGEGFGRTEVGEFLQPVADDLAGALSAGRNYRLTTEFAKQRMEDVPV